MREIQLTTELLIGIGNQNNVVSLGIGINTGIRGIRRSRKRNKNK